MIRLPLSQLGKWDRGQKDMKSRGRERERERGVNNGDGWGRAADGKKRSEIHESRQERGGRTTERRRRKKKNNMKDEGEDEREAGTRIENKREGEGDGSGCQGWGRERSFHSLFFHFVPRQTPGAAVTFPTHSLLSCQYVLQKYNSGGWKKTDCGLFFFFFFLRRISSPLLARPGKKS